MTESLSLFEGNPVAVHLVVGPRQEACSLVKEYFMKLLCKKNSCSVCTLCHAIKDEQHHAITWITPKDNYILDDLEPLFSITSFALEENQRHFFVLSNVDFLSPHCGNRLLKLLEEPPRNYYFILLAERSKNILPTIRSRCIKQSYISGLSPLAHPQLAEFFTQSNAINSALFHKELEASKINEKESIELLDHLLDHFVKQAEDALSSMNKQQYTHTQRMIDIITRGLAHAPMSGSSTIFWKNIMLEVRELQCRN